MSLIWPGLDFIVKAYATWRDKKRAPFQYPFQLYPPPPKFDRGVYASAAMNLVKVFAYESWVSVTVPVKVRDGLITAVIPVPRIVCSHLWIF